MKTWPTKKLGEVAILNPKKSELKDLPDDLLVPFIPMSALDEITQTIKTHELRKLSNVRKGYTYFKEGDILFAKITPCMENGKVAVAKNLKNGIGFGSTEFHVLRPSDKVLSEWIFYIVGSIAFREEAKKHMTGTAGQQRVPIGFLENVKIPLPPLPEQKRIVEKIEKLFAKIDEAERLRAESLAASAALLPSALHQVFNRAKKENWEMRKIEDSCKLPSPQIKGIPRKQYKSVGKFPVIDQGAEFIAGYTNDEYKVYNKILPVIVFGDHTLIFKFVDFDFAPGADGIKILIPNNDFDPKYFYYALQGLNLKSLGYSRHFKILRSKTIPLPPLSEQKKIVAYLDALSQKSQELQKFQQQTSADFSALRQSILAQVFN
jgi:restriction endonuclease S subunit